MIRVGKKVNEGSEKGGEKMGDITKRKLLVITFLESIL